MLWVARCYLCNLVDALVRYLPHEHAWCCEECYQREIRQGAD